MVAKWLSAVSHSSLDFGELNGIHIDMETQGEGVRVAA